MTKKLQIVVADRGWVYIGHAELAADGVIVSEAQNVRRWGTRGKGGLGALARLGPQSETELDAYGTVHIPTHAVMALIDVTNIAAWTSVFPAPAAAA